MPLKQGSENTNM